MVIGNGLMARSFSSYQNDSDCIIFASGVSDSKTVLGAHFLREENLLRTTLEKYPAQRLVYFSTCSINDLSFCNSPYVQHKLAMEDLIKQSARRYLIFRLANIVGKGGNSKTVFNYLFHQIATGKHFQLWSESYRNILDIDHVYHIIDHILKHNQENDIWTVAAPKSHAALELVVAIEQFLNKKAKYDILKKGSSYEIDTRRIRDIVHELGIEFDENYIPQLLEKYYSYEL